MVVVPQTLPANSTAQHVQPDADINANAARKQQRADGTSAALYCFGVLS